MGKHVDLVACCVVCCEGCILRHLGEAREGVIHVMVDAIFC